MRNLRPYLLLFFGLSIIYHSNLRPIGFTDTLGASLTPMALVLDHTLYLDRFGPWLFAHFPFSSGPLQRSRGHYFSGYPVADGILAAPLYVPLALMPGLRRARPCGSMVRVNWRSPARCFSWSAGPSGARTVSCGSAARARLPH